MAYPNDWLLAYFALFRSYIDRQALLPHLKRFTRAWLANGSDDQKQIALNCLYQIATPQELREEIDKAFNVRPGLDLSPVHLNFSDSDCGRSTVDSEPSTIDSENATIDSECATICDQASIQSFALGDSDGAQTVDVEDSLETESGVAFEWPEVGTCYTKVEKLWMLDLSRNTMTVRERLSILHEDLCGVQVKEIFVEACDFESVTACVSKEGGLKWNQLLVCASFLPQVLKCLSEVRGNKKAKIRDQHLWAQVQGNLCVRVQGTFLRYPEPTEEPGPVISSDPGNCRAVHARMAVARGLYPVQGPCSTLPILAKCPACSSHSSIDVETSHQLRSDPGNLEAGLAPLDALDREWETESSDEDLYSETLLYSYLFRGA